MKCGTCKEDFKNISELKKHQRAEHPELYEKAKGRAPAKEPKEVIDMQQADANPNEKGSTYAKQENIMRIKGKAEPTYVCDKCGSPLTKGQKYCAGCGEELAWQ